MLNPTLMICLAAGFMANRNATSNATYDSTFSTTSITSRQPITNRLTGCRLLRPAYWGSESPLKFILNVCSSPTLRRTGTSPRMLSATISNTPAPELLLAAGRKARTNTAPDATGHKQSPAGCRAEHNTVLGRPTPMSRSLRTPPPTRRANDQSPVRCRTEHDTALGQPTLL
ncbi:hypothetical protein PR003_g9594 [Phytophthora rubi]|uniref:Uncharacterized protein n=1 Tax=Phytophthora rubi TaxID=129364 RepID=A0A6A3MUB6_9STRA|nr:hypothetical protein PR002_g9009 [Phytophthora rubi]KAE9035934.1 hypothetical protein PR001_g9067 [Phytophthora rubi]KAE9342205.1 hypothetical protein PR003_g9594 [Phytophthora rubi]